MDINQQIAANILYLMERSGYATQAELSRASGVSATHLSAVLRSMKSATTDILTKLAKALDVEPWQLLARSELLSASAGERCGRLLANYLQADSLGKETIDRVAESQARYLSDDEDP